MTMTAPQITELTAIAAGETVGRASSKDKAAKRFIRLATENGIPNPEVYLDMDFDAAKEALSSEVYVSPTRKAAVEIAAAAAPEPVEKPKRERKPAAPKKIGKRAAILEAAQRGELPEAPDFTAETHKRFRPLLGDVVAAVKDGDIEALKAFEIKAYSSSPKAIAKYRDLAVIALEAQKTAA